MMLLQEKVIMTSDDAVCYVERAMQIIGGKWTILLVHELMGGPRRFGALRRAIPEASAKMLTQRLRDLETSGIVERTIYPEVPPHVEYHLTTKGQALSGTIDELRRWGVDFYAS